MNILSPLAGGNQKFSSDAIYLQFPSDAIYLQNIANIPSYSYHVL